MQTIASTVPRYQMLIRHRGLIARVVGLGIATIVPAAVWTLLISAIASWIGKPLSPQSMFITAAAIVLFLAMVCAPLVLREHD